MWCRFHPVRSGYKQQPKKAWSPWVSSSFSLSLVISLVLLEQVARPVLNPSLCRGLLRKCRKPFGGDLGRFSTLVTLLMLCVRGGEGTEGRSLLLTPCPSLHSSQYRKGSPALLSSFPFRFCIYSSSTTVSQSYFSLRNPI